MKASWIFSLTVVSWIALVQAAWAGELIYWKFNKSQNRLEFITSDGVQPRAQLLSNPARLVIDMPETRVKKAKQTKRLNVSRTIREVRVGQFDRDTARLVVELKPQYTLPQDEIEFRSLSPSRWFVQLPKPIRISPTIAQRPITINIEIPGGSSVPVTIPFPDPSAEPDPTPSRPIPTPVPPRPTRPRSPVASPPIRAGSKVVVIDPGHGGGDPGAVGIGGLQEKRVVLSVGLQVAEQLRRRGIKAVLTRRDDREIDLAPRVATAARVRGDVFVSIHANAISLSRPDINGIETYYYASAEGARLARAIHNQILRQTNARDRGVRQARFYVLRRTKMPAVLIETGFVTGSQDAARLSSPAQRTKLAAAIADGIMDYLQR